MDFCDKCGNLMITERESNRLRYVCRKCGHTVRSKRAISTSIEERIKSKKMIVPVFSEDDDLRQYPINKEIVCPNCENRGAYWFMQQTRAADEAPTMFLCCTKCKHKWREY